MALEVFVGAGVTQILMDSGPLLVSIKQNAPSGVKEHGPGIPPPHFAEYHPGGQLGSFGVKNEGLAVGLVGAAVVGLLVVGPAVGQILML